MIEIVVLLWDVRLERALQIDGPIMEKKRVCDLQGSFKFGGD